MKKRLLGKKGFTLLEVILAICMIAIIALPMLTVFSQSIKVDQAAKGVLNANYISQGYIENLDASSYGQALSDLPNHEKHDNYYLSATIKPYGTNTSLFSERCDYAHIVYYDNGKMLAVLPDGKWHMFNSGPSSISIQVNDGEYAFTGGSVPINGTTDTNNCAVIVNAMKKTSDTTSSIELLSGCKGIIYTQNNDIDDFIIDGVYESYVDLTTGEESLVHVKTFVYDTSTSVDPLAVSDAYINVNNLPYLDDDDDD